jgi:hypothetical protein
MGTSLEIEHIQSPQERFPQEDKFKTPNGFEFEKRFT